MKKIIIAIAFIAASTQIFAQSESVQDSIYSKCLEHAQIFHEADGGQKCELVMLQRACKIKFSTELAARIEALKQEIKRRKR